MYHIYSVKLFSKSSLLVKFLTFGSKNVIRVYSLNFLLSLMIQECHHILSNFLLWSKNFTRQNLLLNFISLELYDPIMSSDSIKLMIQKCLQTKTCSCCEAAFSLKQSAGPRGRNTHIQVHCFLHLDHHHHHQWPPPPIRIQISVDSFQKAQIWDQIILKHIIQSGVCNSYKINHK